jgi:uncharacterized protein
MILRDAVHGLIGFESEENAIVPRLLATREVQRLRRIRQLGFASFAYPGAEHTRFPHALGAAHVMGLFVARLRQIDHDLPFWQRVTSERARDAIAAAFLHDVGHGPLSHLFEEALPEAPSHEEWTEQILLDPATEVHRVLAADDPYLPQRVVELVRGRHPLPYLARAVSGTFDVDRCDYLLRDAHATGVRYGEYDLPWLLRSLRFDEAGSASGSPRGSGSLSGSDGAAGSASVAAEGPGLAIDGAKGLVAIEAFLLARLFMFQQVYFHKSTRSAEWLIGAILRRAVAILRDGTRLPSVPEAFLAVAVGDRPTTGQYLELDDQVLLGALHTWENAADPVLSDLCKRLRARSLFKTVELYPERPERGRAEEAGGARALTHLTPEEALATAREITKAAGLDPEVYVGLDVASITPYAEDESLRVVFPRGRPRLPSEVSFLLDRLRNETVTRVRVIFAPELRDAMREALIR